jgi:predicted phage-related endonuclease
MIVPIPQSRADWLKMRLGYIGASETAALWDAQPDFALSKFALWHVKAGLIPAPDVEEERADWGVLLEPVVARETARREGWGIEHGGFAVDDTTPGLSATLDFQVISHTEPDHAGRGALEVKCVDWLQFKRVWNGSPPLHIELQLQHQLAATGYSWGAIAALVSGNELHVWKRRARPRIIDGIRQRVREFWASIEAKRSPSADGTDSTSAALKALYAVPQDRDAEIPEEDAPAVAEACALFLIERETRLAGAKREEAAKNLIRAAMGDAARAFVTPLDASGPAYRISRDKRNAITVKEVAPT